MNGIGGCTISQAKNALTYGEYLTWVRYVKKNGPLNGARRVEITQSLIAAQFGNLLPQLSNRRLSQPFKMDDFLAYKEPEPERYATTDEIFGMIKALAKPTNKPGDK